MVFWKLRILLASAIFIVIFGQPVLAALLNAGETGFGGQSRANNYDLLVNSIFSNGKVAVAIGDKLWVPWFKTSSSCQQSDLQSGSNCNSGQTIDFTHNCMVTDEFSQVGILVSMGKDQSRMDEFYNTVVAAKSTNGNIPGWRLYRNQDSIEPCRSGINGNCDTASDGTVRIIIALFGASKNSYFADSAQKNKYADLAKKLSADFLNYEVDKTCRPSSLGYGNICYWMAGGSNAKRGGISSPDYAYPGYYPDGIIAMLQAYANTGDSAYLDAAKSFTLNYLQAANFDGNNFRVPPGESFKWVIDPSGIPRAQCTKHCNPDSWDYADATRALGMCQANYYATQMGQILPGLQKYCNLWGDKYMGNPSSAPIQYYSNGISFGTQSGYFAQGLQSLFESGYNPTLYKYSLDSALNHFVISKGTFDSSPCLGVYTQAFAIRSLGMGIGRDAASFGQGFVPESQSPTTQTITASACTPTTEVCDGKDNNCNGLIDENNVCGTPTPPPAGGTAYINVQNIPAICTGGTIISDNFNGGRTVECTGGANKLTISAWDKPDTANAQYFEMYKQTGIGSGLKVCLLGTCIGDNGFAVSPNYPLYSSPTCTPSPEVCDGKDNNCNGLIDENNVCGNLNSQTTVGLAGLPIIVYPSGTKIADNNDGNCRTVTFSTAYDPITAKACYKDSNRYEMYLLTPPSPFSICVTSYCVGQLNGFASFNYP